MEKVLEFPLKHHSFQREHLGLISFRMDWLDLLAVPGTQSYIGVGGMENSDIGIDSKEMEAFKRFQVRRQIGRNS